MEKQYHSITPTQINSQLNCVHTNTLPELVHLDDPAQNAMIDFYQFGTTSIDKAAPLRDARYEMQACNVHMLLVTGSENEVVGIITIEDILGNKPIKLSQDMSMTRNDIQVRMIMQPCAEVLAITQHDVSVSQVGHIVETMKVNRQHYILVVEQQADQNQMLRGFFSLSNIGRQLHSNLQEVDLMATSLLELQRRLDSR